MQSLQNKVALVTGAGKGIGRAIAVALAAEGVSVGLIARTEKDLLELSKELDEKKYANCFAIADISKEDEVLDAIKKIEEKLGHINILINNAGTGKFANFLDLTTDEWEQQIKVNLFGVYYATKAVLPNMIQQKNGDIINISSTAGKAGGALTSAYSASKFGVFGLGESLMQEVRKHNVRVTTLAPSTIVTELAKSADLIKGNEENILHPEDLAELVVAHLKLSPRVLIKEASIFSTNP